MVKASILLVLMWSSGYLGAELGARYSSWHMLLACRFLVAAVLLVGFCVVMNRGHRRRSAAELDPCRRRSAAELNPCRRRSAAELDPCRRRSAVGMNPWRVTPRGLARQVALGVVMQGLYLSAIGAAVQAGLSAGITALICSLQPLVVAAGAFPLLGERIGRREWCGLVVGVVGVGLVVGGKLNTGGAPWWAFLLCALGMLALTGGTLAQRILNAPEPMAVALAVQCTVGAVLFWFVNVVVGEVIPPITIEFAGSVVWVVALSTFGGWGAYMWVNREAGPVLSSTLLLLVPPATMLIAWPMFGDALGPWEIVGVAVSALGVAIKLLGTSGQKVSGTKRSDERTPARNTEVCGPEKMQSDPELLQSGRE